MHHTRLLPIALLFVLSGALSACTKDLPTTPTPDPVTTHLVTTGSLSLAVGDSTQVRAVVTLPDGTSQIVTNTATWTSSVPAVATTNASGVITALSVGTTEVSLTYQDLTAKIAVTVSAAVATPTTYWGTTTGLNTVAGTVNVTRSTSTRVTGTFYLGRSAITLFGNFDAPTNVVNMTGGGFTFTGTVNGALLTGTFVDADGNTGGFTAIDATHTAITTYCGSYTSDGTTALQNQDAGVFAFAVSIDGTVSGTSLPSDASNAPLFVAGRRTGDALALTTNQGATGAGQIQNGTATGTYQTALGSIASFTATTSACR